MIYIKDKNNLKKLIIKTFHINKVLFAEKTYIEDRVLYIRKDIKDQVLKDENIIDELKVNIIYPNNHDIFINSVLDVSPIATKVSGNIGEGVTHLLTGVVVMITGVEKCGFQPSNIGSSEGILSNQIKFDRRGTPSKKDIILHTDVTLMDGYARDRKGIIESHRVCDRIIQEIREYLKETNNNLCEEVHEYLEHKRNKKKKVLIIKQVSGLGCMYDTGIFPIEPAGFIGSKSIMDLGNMPVFLTPNQYRDGAIRAMS